LSLTELCPSCKNQTPVKGSTVFDPLLTVLPLAYVFHMHLSGRCCHGLLLAAYNLLYPWDSLIHTYMSCCLYNVAGSRPRANDDAVHGYICRADFNKAAIDGPPVSIQYVPCIREHQHTISAIARAVLKLEWEVVSRHIKWFHLLSFWTNSRCRSMLPSRC
jgi:hypothetical protein